MIQLNDLQKKFVIVLSIVTVACLVVAVSGYELFPSVFRSAKPSTQASGSNMATRPTTLPTVAATPTFGPPPDPKVVLGIDGDQPSAYPGITWIRLNYRTCGNSHLSGGKLINKVQLYRSRGIHVLLLLCQRPGLQLLDTTRLQDVARAGADAVACGNEQMKHNTYTTYVPPDSFAHFFDLCQSAVHAVNPNAPVLLGSLDPHVGGIDFQPLMDQVNYLDMMEKAMNTQVHPGGHWSWRSQTLGLIDSWHNGFPTQNTNSLQALFTFWAQQFHVDLASGALGQHIWVVEGTGCVYECGLNSNYQISVAHILTLITDVQTSMHYGVPFFYFSGKDFVQQNQFWPMGVLSATGHAKPLRQDLKLGDRTLDLTCSTGQVQVINQEQLLAKLYSGCSPPGNYTTVLTN